MIRTVLMAVGLVASSSAQAEDLFKKGSWSALASDRRASQVGDALTVVIYQSAEATNSAENSSRKSSDASGAIGGGSLNETGGLSFGGGYTGRGETRRSEKLIAQLSVNVTDVLPNGDMLIAGHQRLHVNGENTTVGVKGRVRPVDIAANNSVLSSRIADAEIEYGGRGFVSRSARPGLVNQLFRLLGLG